MTAIIRYEDGDSSGTVSQQDCGAWDVAFPASLPLSEVAPSLSPTFAQEPAELGEIRTFSAQLQKLGLYSVATVPLFVKGALFGAVVAWGEGENRFTLDDAEMLAAVAGPFAIALEKAAALESLADSERRYRTLVSSSQEMIFLFDADSRRILDGNEFAAQTLGYTSDELFALRIDDFFDGEPLTLESDVAALLEQGELHTTERRYRRSNGNVFEVDIVASAINYDGRSAILVLARDVSDQRSLQRQLVQSQKMESLGSMAGMVAHDFNNLLTTILGFAGLLKRSATLDVDERENLSMIEDAARRAADLTGRLLSFARGGLARFGPVDLREVITDTLSLAQTAIPQSIRLTTELPVEPLIVEGDGGQLQSAIMNIVLNAKDAMPDGGSLHIELCELDSAARVTITDTGAGMDEETRTRMFEPFYTTKPAGSGTGLGMSITYGIVQGHHGGIDVQSERGSGTCFTLTFPTFHEAPPVVEDSHVPVDGTLILIVDDDEMVRRSTSATLVHLGYNVVQAASGATAIELVRARPERFAAMLLDLVMPGLTGSETFRAVSAIRSDLPVIICTGYAAEAHIDMDVKRRIAGLIQKPFAVERLTAMLTVVGAPPPRA
jgi:PAS domain S-box-containing protein